MEATDNPKKYTNLIGDELYKGSQLHQKVKQKVMAGKPYQQVLSELLEQVKPVSFRELAKIEAEAKLTKKHYVVLVVDEVVRVALSNSWGLCTKNGFIYVYNGKYWQVVDVEDFKTFLAAAADKLGAPAIDAKYHQFKDELHKQFLSVANLPTPEAKPSVLINLQNGTFEITKASQKLREPRQEDFLKYQLPFEHDLNARCKLFDRYLNRVLPDASCQQVLAEYLGYLFIQNLKLEKALILYGSGANGKSVFFEIVNALLGEENICSYSLQNLTKPDGYQRAELQNKLLNYASEINGKLESSIFKQLVSGEPVDARQIYAKPFTMRSYAKLIFNCNELPKEVEQTHAFFRRFIIIPFSQTIPEVEQDPELAKKIIETELSGVFNWMLDGLSRLLEQAKFTTSQAVTEQLNAYRRESDSVAMFIDEEGYVKSIEGSIPLKDLYGEYKTFCMDNGYRPCSAKTLSERLKTLGFEAQRKMLGNVVYLKK